MVRLERLHDESVSIGICGAGNEMTIHVSIQMRREERAVLMMPIHLQVFFDPPFPGIVYVRKQTDYYGDILIQNVTKCIELRTKKREENACQWGAARTLGGKRGKHKTQCDDPDSDPLNSIDRSLQNDTGVERTPDCNRTEGDLEQATATVRKAKGDRRNPLPPNRSDDVSREVA